MMDSTTEPVPLRRDGWGRNAWVSGTLRTLRRLPFLIALGGMLASCATAPNDARNAAAKSAGDVAAVAKPVLTSDGLALVRSTPRAKLWVKPDHHIGRYDDLLVTEIAFAYAAEQEPLDEEQEREVGAMLKRAIAEITSSGPLKQASSAGPCALVMRMGLKDLRLHIVKDIGSNVSYVSSFGDATIIVEFRDSETDTALVRYAAHRGLGGGPGTGRLGANLGRLGQALGKMVTDMTTELQTIVPDTTVRGETECNDGVYKWSGRG